MKYEPLITSLLDTDRYKISMLRMVKEHYSDLNVSWKLTNRSTSVKLAEQVDIFELDAQLKHVQSLKWSDEEITWLISRNIIDEEFGKWIQTEWGLSDYFLYSTTEGQIELEFFGPYVETQLWETIALAIVNNLRNKKLLKSIHGAHPAWLVLAAENKLEDKLRKLHKTNAKFSDFGTRRRFSYDHQKTCVLMAMYTCPDNFVGTSNLLIAKELNIPAIGTNAHELPMVVTAKAFKDKDSDFIIKWAQYDVLKKWGEMYPESKIMLPDTYGTIQFLYGTPDDYTDDGGRICNAVDLGFLDWGGIRVDSMNPYLAAGVIYNWYVSNGVDPKTKKVIFSDGLDVDDIIKLNDLYGDVFQLSFGWGTLFTNDFRGLSEAVNIDPISIVVKVSEVDGEPCAKISDNPEKCLADPATKEKYLRVFGNQFQQNQKVIV